MPESEHLDNETLQYNSSSLSQQHNQQQIVANLNDNDDNNNTTNVRDLIIPRLPRSDQQRQINQFDNLTLPTAPNTRNLRATSGEIPTTDIVVPASEVSILDNHYREPVIEGHLVYDSTPVVEADTTCFRSPLAVSTLRTLAIFILVITVLTVLLVLKLKEKSKGTTFASSRPSQSVAPSTIPSSLPNVNPSEVPSESVAPSYLPSSPVEWVRLGSVYGIVAEEAIGESLAISNKGNRAYIGGSDVLRIYGYADDGSWSLEHDLSSFVEGFSFSMSVSLGGKHILLGLSTYGSENQGAAVILREDGSNGWEQQGFVIGEKEGAEFGLTVAITGDGTTIAVSNQQGYVKLYQYSNEHYIFSNNFDVIDNRYWSISMSMTPDGSLIALGNPAKSEVFLYAIPSRSLLQKIVPESNIASFGYNVLVSDDKSCIVITSLDPREERVDVYRLDHTLYYKKRDTILGPSGSTIFGVSLSLCYNCKRLVIGAPHYSTLKGITFVYTYRHERWNLVGSFNGERKLDKFGYSVALSFDGNRVGVGIPTNENGGLVEFFESTGGLPW